MTPTTTSPLARTGRHRPARRPARRGGWFGDGGGAAVELVLAVPVLLVMFGFVIYAGRLADLNQDVTNAAHQGSRAATLAATPTSADDAARGAVAAQVDAGGVACATLTIAVDTTSFAPGGYVTVTVSCTVAANDLAFLPLGTKTVTATSTSVIDTYTPTRPAGP